MEQVGNSLYLKDNGQQIKLVILDVDGVILDLHACFEENWIAAASKVGLPKGPIVEYLDGLKSGNRPSRGGLYDGVREVFPSISEERIKKFEVYFRAIEEENPYPLIEGSLETIHWLRELGIPIALCTTNNQNVLQKRFDSVSIDLRWFDAVSTGDWEYIKPHPRAFDPIFGLLSIPKEQALYVGDFHSDVIAAKGAGISFIAVLTGKIPQQSFLAEGVIQERILERLSDLRNIMEIKM